MRTMNECNIGSLLNKEEVGIIHGGENTVGHCYPFVLKQ